MRLLRGTNQIFKYNPGYVSSVNDFCTALNLGIMIGHSKAGTFINEWGLSEKPTP
jgi:hypothetical protein